MRPATTLLLAALSCACQSAPEQATAEGRAGPMARNEWTFAVGEFNEAPERGLRFGVDYERRSPEGWGPLFDERWGFGAMADFYLNPIDSVLLALQAVHHPVEPVSLILAAGFNGNYEGDTGEDAWLGRIGTRYSFPAGKNVSIGPEIFYDMLEGGERRGVLALALTVML